MKMLMTIKEVALRLKISLSMAYNLIARGEIPCYAIGSCKRVDESDLQEYLHRQKQETTTRPKPQSKHF